MRDVRIPGGRGHHKNLAQQVASDYLQKATARPRQKHYDYYDDKFKALKQEHELSKKAWSILWLKDKEIFGYIESQRREYSLAMMFRLYDVSATGYYS